VSILAVGTAATDTARTPSASVELRAALLALGTPPAECETQCEYTSCWSSSDHKNQAHANGTNTGTIHGCQFTENGCRDHDCEVTFGDAHVSLADLENLLRAVSGDALATMAQLNGRLIINRARGAAQIISCGARVVVSVQLSPRQITEIAAAE
jgi:hypothetical protein